MLFFSEKYCLPDKKNISLINEGTFRAYFEDVVCNVWFAPSAVLSFTDAFLRQHGQRNYLLSLAGGALRDAYVALKYLSYIALYDSFYNYNYWNIFWDFMHYWIKDYDIWVHISPEQNTEKNSQMLKTYCNNIYNGDIPLEKSVTSAYKIMYSRFYTNYPLLTEHIKKIVKDFKSPDYFSPVFFIFGNSINTSKFGKLINTYKKCFPEGINHLLNVDIPSPYLFDEKDIGQYVSKNSHFLPNMPITMSIQIMVTTKTPSELLSSFDWNINRFGWTVDPFVNSTENTFDYKSKVWYMPESPFKLQHNATPNADLLQTLTRLANLAAKYSIVPLEIQRKYPEIAWKKILKKMHSFEEIQFQLSNDFLYEIICNKLFTNDSNQ